MDSVCLCLPSQPSNASCDGVADSEKVYYEFTTLTTTDDFDLIISQPQNMSELLIDHLLGFKHYYSYKLSVEQCRRVFRQIDRMAVL